MGKENKKPSKKMKQTSIKDAANVIRISRRHTKDWHLIGLKRQRLRTGRPRGPSRSRSRSRSPPRSSTVRRDLSSSSFKNVSKWKYFALIFNDFFFENFSTLFSKWNLGVIFYIESQGRHHLMAMEPSMRNACRTHQTTKKSSYPRFVYFFSLNRTWLKLKLYKMSIFSQLW